ncbi:uncharacterized protein LOC134529085 [Bacillus rossius redtenbacheri]|uniref:uncharacterized protein LOC134529085 n=1 Tax=Bacillus rossius redtenbacheri TaxID=93214 RepID=UPI002FDD0A35
MSCALLRGPLYSSNPSTMNISNTDTIKHRCTCCPYGYHIDLDFVQFCELFSQNNTVSASKQRRREKRLQRQSMEVLLGLTSPVVWNLEQHLPKIPQEDSMVSSSSCSQTAKIVQDALHGAVQDFQETLERAQNAASADKALFMPANGEIEEKYSFSAGTSPEMDVCATVIKHSESVMSLSSVGTSCSPAYTNREVPDGIIFRALQVTSPVNDYDASSLTSAASGLSAVALQNIREQMALSLKRMKELEEQVKLIPVLQVQLSVLKEEKRKLLLQIRQEDAGKSSNDSFLKLDSFHKTLKKNIDPLNFHNTIPRCSRGDEKNWTSTYKEKEENVFFVCRNCSKLYSAEDTNSRSQLTDSWSRHNYQDVGVSCCVVTRDVGICHQQPRMYNAETYVNFSEKTTTAEHTKKISLTSNSISQPHTEKAIHLSNSLNGILSKRDVAVNTSRHTSKIGVQTEISQSHVAIQIDLPLPKPKRVRVSYKVHKNDKLRKLKARLKRKLKKQKIIEKLSVGVMTELEDVFKKPENEGRLLQEMTLNTNCKKDASTATWPLMLTTASKCIDTSEFFASRIKDVAVNTQKVHVTDVAIGDRNINIFHRNVSCHLPYKPDQNKSRDIAVNTQKVELVDVGVGSKMYPGFQRSVLCQCNIIGTVNKGSFKDSATNTVKTPVIDVAVGNRYSKLQTKSISCQCNIQAEDIKSICRDPVVNLEKVKMIDAAVGCEDRNILQRSVSCQYDSVTEETLVNSSKKSPNLSRIPRPVDRYPANSQHVKEKNNFDFCEKFPTNFEMEKFNVSVAQESSSLIAKEHHQEVRLESALVESPVSTYQTKMVKEQKIDLGIRRPTVEYKRFQTGSANLGLHMLDHAKSDHFVQKEQTTSYTESNLDHSLTFQPIWDVSHKKSEPSKEIKAAIKVLNDCLMKSNSDGLPSHVKSAANIIQQEWFHVSSTSSAAPLEVEDYLDFFEETSSKLLEYIVNMTDISGNTAMHYAVSHGNFDVVSILLDSKVCNINQPNAAGYTCVMLVSLADICSETHRQVVRRLFQLADVNVRAQQHGQTALMLAVSHGRLDTVKLLIEAGADMNIQDEDGSTALMCAAEHGHKDIVKQLLSNPDCDVTIADCDGTTALDIAMEAGNRDIGVLIYGRQVFSRSASPHSSRHRRSKSATPLVHGSSPLHIHSPQNTNVRGRHDKTL